MFISLIKYHFFKYKLFISDGIECFDGLKNENFTFHCSVVSWSGDTPALTKLMYTTGHNSYEGCRYCKLRDTYEKHVYYPTTPPRNTNGMKYIPEHLLKKRHQDYLQNIRTLNEAKNNTQKKQLEKNTSTFLRWHNNKISTKY